MDPIYEGITTSLLSEPNDGSIALSDIDDNNSQYHSTYSPSQRLTPSNSSTGATSSYDDSFVYMNHTNERDDDESSRRSKSDSHHSKRKPHEQQQQHEKPKKRCCCRHQLKCSKLCTCATLSTIFLLLLAFLLIGSLIGLPTLAFLAAFHGKVKLTSYYIAGFFVLLTLPISLHEIIQHLTKWYMPSVQKYVVRILFMVPIYSVQSWLSLYFQSATFYIDTLRELYEAFVISSFVYYLVALLGGEETLKTTLRNKDAKHERHPFLIHWMLGEWTMGNVFLLWCKVGVLQYVVVKTIASILTMILRGVSLYEEGKFGWREPFTYVSIALNISMAFAMYCLVKFFYATKEELRSPVNWRPIGKFLCIKGVVFFTWWQGFFLTILESYGVITNIGNWDSKLVAGGLQDLLICAEMLCFAIAHRYTFTHKEYAPAYVGDALLTGMDVPLDEDDHHVDKDNTGGGGGGGEMVSNHGLGMQNVARQQQQQQQQQEADEYNPPTIRQLDVPVSVRRAVWSSAIPNEMFKDIVRLSRGANAAAMDSNDEFIIDMKDAQGI